MRGEKGRSQWGGAAGGADCLLVAGGEVEGGGVRWVAGGEVEGGGVSDAAGRDAMTEKAPEIVVLARDEGVGFGLALEKQV